MTKEEYERLLDKHDWYYMFSDDHRIYEEGVRQERELKAQTEFVYLYLEMSKTIFKQ